ncbi:MAG: phosphatidylserine decarboxylase family protein [Candidatus Aureabacteria bacterium]|jgi:phosphatidylserine decarboxylase|nr:phosphatidylserine decarboxylase family protein [Candidatus Auribacterota bacterium]
MRVAREGLPYIALAFAFAAAAAIVGRPWAFVFLALAACITVFFRDPPRAAPTTEGAVIAPAHGRVTRIDEVAENGYFGRRVRRISIFMSVLDVHVNYAPVSGTVEYLHYRRGSFKNAMRDAASVVNENNTIGIIAAGTPTAVRQIAGMIARRIVCRCTVGDRVQAGQRIGLIKFGSRVDVFLPLEARVLVREGQRVRGGETMIAGIG